MGFRENRGILTLAEWIWRRLLAYPCIMLGTTLVFSYPLSVSSYIFSLDVTNDCTDVLELLNGWNKLCLDSISIIHISEKLSTSQVELSTSQMWIYPHRCGYIHIWYVDNFSWYVDNRDWSPNTTYFNHVIVLIRPYNRLQRLNWTYTKKLTMHMKIRGLFQP